MDTEFVIVTGGLKVNRRWISCGDPNMCSNTPSEPPDELIQLLKTTPPGEMKRDHDWLMAVLPGFTSFPGMTFGTIGSPDEPLEHYAVVVTMPVPDSNRPQTWPNRDEWFTAGRLVFVVAPILRSTERLVAEIYAGIEAVALHEVREFTKFRGEHVIEPHPATDEIKKVPVRA